MSDANEIKKPRTILTGIKPTGAPHLGNLLGAIKPALSLMENAGPQDKIFYFIADYHALTSLKDPKKFNEHVYDVAATWLALGLDPKRSYFYRQSDIPEIFELSWILGCFTAKGDMNRAHAYKAIVQENETKGESDLDAGVNMGLYSYPVLMAADILLYETNLVPVGKDQVQHIEIARNIAGRINALFPKTLVLPEAMVPPNAATVPGLDGRKMSKSYDNTIPLFLEAKQLQKLINKIKTDSLPPEAPKDPETSNIFQIYREFATQEQVTALRQRYEQGIGWGEAKLALFEVLDAYLKEPRERYKDLMANKDEVDRILKEGAEKTREIAAANLNKIKKVLGIFR